MMSDEMLKELVADLCILYRGVHNLEDTESNEIIERSRQRVDSRAVRYLMERVRDKQKADIQYKIDMLQMELKTYD